MRSLLVALGICLVAAPLGSSDGFDTFRRGDANNDGVVTAADSLTILAWFWNDGPQPPCMKAADANDDGLVSISDASAIANWLYLGGPEPPAPGAFACGVDPTWDLLTCGAACE